MIRRSLLLLIDRFAEAILLLLALAREPFRGRPRPSDAPLISGIAPAQGGKTQPLSKSQLTRLEAWLRLHHERWRRSVIPPARPSHMVQVEHSDGTEMFVMMFLCEQFNIYFATHTKDKIFDAGWLSLPAEEVHDLIAMLGKEA